MSSTRTYTMTARAEAAERTRLAVLGAAAELAGTKRLADISLDDVATTAGVSVQTVLRKFGSRAGLLEAAAQHAARRVDEVRRTPVGDVEAALDAVVDHHERRGDGVLLLLAQEASDPQVRAVVAHGRARHRGWVRTVFAPYLPDSPGPAYDELVDLLAVATDVHTWQQLRRGRGLDRDTTTDRMHHLVVALI